jgi:hypothetical protein
MFKDHAIVAECVNRRRLRLLGAVNSHVVCPQSIDGDQKKIGTMSCFRDGTRRLLRYRTSRH